MKLVYITQTKGTTMAINLRDKLHDSVLQGLRIKYFLKHTYQTVMYANHNLNSYIIIINLFKLLSFKVTIFKVQVF